MTAGRSMAIVLAGLVVLAMGCSGGDSGSTATDVAVSLTDDAIILDLVSVPTGTVSFAVTNDGSVAHELEVIEGDGSEITVSRDVADLSSSNLIDEVEDVVPGVTVDLDVDLAPGIYTLICNYPGHYAMGMVTTLTVTG